MIKPSQIESMNNNILEFLEAYNSNPLPVMLFGVGGSIDAYISLIKKRVHYIHVESLKNNKGIFYVSSKILLSARSGFVG